MTESTPAQINAEGERIAKAALGIPDEARVIPFDLSQAAFVVIAHPDGMVDLTATITAPEVVAGLRVLADKLEAKFPEAGE